MNGRRTAYVSEFDRYENDPVYRDLWDAELERRADEAGERDRQFNEAFDRDREDRR